MAESLPANVEKLLQDLKSPIRADRKSAIEELVRLRITDKCVIDALKTAAISDSKQNIRDIAKEALRTLGHELPLAEGGSVVEEQPTYTVEVEDRVNLASETGQATVQEKGRRLGILGIAAIVSLSSIAVIVVISLFGPLIPNVPWGSLIQIVSCIGGIAVWVLIIGGLYRLFTRSRR